MKSDNFCLILSLFAIGVFPEYNYNGLWPITDVFIRLICCLPPLKCKLCKGQVFI